MRHLTLGLVLILLAAPAMADPGVHTDREGARVLPLPKEEGVFHFLVFGDRTGGPVEGLEVLKTAVRDANLLGPDLEAAQGFRHRPARCENLLHIRTWIRSYHRIGNHSLYNLVG